MQSIKSGADMSVFSDKRIFGIKRNNVGGITTAGQVSANDIILWSVFLLPVHIAMFGAGQCIVAVGLFIGNVFGWLFLSKRMNSYTEFSDKKIHNASEFFEARYGSKLIKNLSGFIWILSLVSILAAVLNNVAEMVSSYLNFDKKVCMGVVLLLLVLATVFFDNKAIGIGKTVIFIALIVLSIATIVYLFTTHSAVELLDIYRKTDIPGDTSKYLNILYYKGERADVINMISMLSVGMGCIGMPFMYKGVINIRDIKGLDSSRIWAVTFEGLTIISTSVISLLIAPVIYPAALSGNESPFEAYNMFYKSLLAGKEYSYGIRMAVLIIYVMAVAILMESLMRNVSEHIRGLVPVMKKQISVKVKLVIDIMAVIVAAVIVFFCAKYLDIEFTKLILLSWGICASGLAAPCIMALMWKKSTKYGILSGIITGITTYLIWRFVPILNERAMSDATGLCADIVGFLFSMAVIIIVSMFTKKTDEAEQRVFEQMRMSQR